MKQNADTKRKIKQRRTAKARKQRHIEKGTGKKDHNDKTGKLDD